MLALNITYVGTLEDLKDRVYSKTLLLTSSLFTLLSFVDTLVESLNLESNLCFLVRINEERYLNQARTDLYFLMRKRWCGY